MYALSATALLAIDAAKDAPDQAYKAPTLLIRDVFTIRHNAKITRKRLLQAAGTDITCLQITSMLTVNSDKLLVISWSALAEIASEKVAATHLDAYCRELAWLYGRQLELLEMLDAQTEGRQSHDGRDTVGDYSQDRGPQSRSQVV
jgi:hypothetical protein